MNWNVSEWKESEWKELEAKRLHHPECKKPGETIESGRTPRLTHSGARISWIDSKGTFGHSCATGVKAPTKQKGDAADMEAALDRLGDDDEEARKLLAALTLKQLARIATGRGAQQLRALELISELTKVGLTPEVANPDTCPIGQGKQDCPVCGGRHQSVEIHVSDDLMRSLNQLTELQDEEARQAAADKRFAQ